MTDGGGETIPRPEAVPTAVVRPERRRSWAWLIPVAAALFAAWLGWTAWRDRGVPVTVQLPDGHGLKVGNDVRFRGITVGLVEDVTLSDDLGAVSVRLRLRRQADRLARAGSRFWIVRPRLRLSGIEGIETIFGPRYVGVRPGAADARRQRLFIGLVEPPVIGESDPDDLEIILQADRRGSLHPGAPVSYRQVRVGTVVSVGLASDGGLVEARAHIEKAYRALIRPTSRFWDVGGVNAKLGLTGIDVQIDSVEELLVGGVAVATPPADEAGAPVHTGYRFTLHDSADDEWLEWIPTAPVGSSLLPAGATIPQPLRATLIWQESMALVFRGHESRSGWLLQTEHGMLGPVDLLTASDAEEGTIFLQLAGVELPMELAPSWSSDGLALLDLRVEGTVWPTDRCRNATEPEDCIAVGDPTAPPLPLAPSRLRAERDGYWSVDPAVTIDPTWHGAALIARADGALIGILLVVDEDAAVALLPPISAE